MDGEEQCGRAKAFLLSNAILIVALLLFVVDSLASITQHLCTDADTRNFCTMSDSDSEPSAASAILHSVMENLKHLPASSESHYQAGSSSSTLGSSSYGGFFGARRQHVHDLLGGGHSADVLLWRKKHLSAGFLVGATVVWILFEWVGYHFVSLVAFVLLGLVIVLFAWSNAAAFLNRAPPPIPYLQLSDEQVLSVARNVKVQVNKGLAILHGIVIGKDFKRFLKLVGALAFLVMFGSWFNFLTLIYLAVVVAHTLPVLYEKHGDSIDQLAESAWKEVNNQYRKFDATVLSKIPRKRPTFERKSN